LTDSLTGLANRRALDAAVVRAIARARRDRRTVHRAFIDIDHFKDINDSLGHAVGDSVLQAVGRGSGIVFDAAICWRATEARSSSHCCPTRTSRPRCGLPRSSGAVIASLDFDPLTGGLPVRVSIGVAQLSEELMGAGSLVLRRRLGDVRGPKRQGRNRVGRRPLSPVGGRLCYDRGMKPSVECMTFRR